MTSLLILCVFPALVVYAAVTDVLTMTIPNSVVIAIIVAFMAIAPAVGMDLELVAWHLAAGASVFVLTFAAWSLGYIGGGDAKMLPAAALWVGFPQLVGLILIMAMAGGALALLVINLKSLPLPVAALSHPWVVRLQGSRHLPYGVAVAAGALAVYPHSAMMQLIIG